MAVSGEKKEKSGEKKEKAYQMLKQEEDCEKYIAIYTQQAIVPVPFKIKNVHNSQSFPAHHRKLLKRYLDTL